MTVVGSLEDLSFPDILQVVHVSRQSGTLVLTGPEGERRVRFHNGLVCGATLGDRGLELEELLVQKGLVNPRALGKARDRSEHTGTPLSSVLVEQGVVSQETIERIVRDELRSLLRSLVLVQNGEFRFELEASRPPPGRELDLRDGLGPESILQGIPPPGRPRSARARRAATTREQGAGRVLLVVERSILRLALKDELVRRGFEVEGGGPLGPGEDPLQSVSESGPALGLVCDLLLPGAAGEGICGGLELVRRARARRPGITAIVIGDSRDPGTRRRAQAAGAAAYLPLPDLADAPLVEIAPRLARFCSDVGQALEDPAHPGARDEAPGSVRAVDQLSLLRGLIGEMHGEQAGEIPLLVLRLAAEYFDRGVLFAVRDGDACGAGAFGGEGSTAGADGLDTRIRGVVLPLQRGSALRQVVQDRSTYVGPIAPTPPNALLVERLGGRTPSEAALLPLLSGQHVFGILYGDNARSGRLIGDLKALEIFLTQAGMALENVFLQRRIASLARAGGGRRSSGDA